MPGTNEAFSRVKIDAQLRDQGWEVLNPNAVRFEYILPDRTKADYVLCDRHGRALAVVEAKKAAINPAEAEAQAKAYAVQLEIPYIFLANGEEIRFWEWQREAFPRVVKTFFKQDDLERRFATRQLKRDPMTVEIDQRIVERDYQRECIDTLCREMNNGRRKLLIEMATGTGKTRTAAALIKRLFEAHAITRVLFLVDRIPLAKQTEDAFAEHLPDFPAYVLRAGRRFQDEKRITITTLQSMINVYGEYSAGLSFVDVPEQAYIDGTLGVYELNRVELLRDVFVWAYERSCQRYVAIKESLPEPDPTRLRNREALIKVVGEIVRGEKPIDTRVIRELAAPLVKQEDLGEFVAMVFNDLHHLHEGNIVRYRLRLPEFRAWKKSRDAL